MARTPEAVTKPSHPHGIELDERVGEELERSAGGEEFYGREVGDLRLVAGMEVEEIERGETRRDETKSDEENGH